MTTAYWRNLAVLTVTDPAAAARQLMALGLQRDVLWLALALAIVLNTAIFAASQMALAAMDPALSSNDGTVVWYAAFVGGGAVLTIFAIFHVGRIMGGTGSFDDVMVLLVWMQFLRAAVQAAGVILLLTIPILSALLALAAFLIGFYIFVHFVDQAHRLGSLGRAAGVLVVSVLALAVILLILDSLFGGVIVGAAAHV